MKPAPGVYRLTTPGPTGPLAWDLRVTETGATGPFGETFVYAPGDILVSSTRALTIECDGSGTGSAVYGSPPTTVVFGCQKIG